MSPTCIKATSFTLLILSVLYSTVTFAYDCDENCTMLIGQALKNHSRPFIPDNYHLSVSVGITFASPAISFTSCCTTYEHKQRTVELNPLSSQKVAAVYARTNATASVVLRDVTNSTHGVAGNYFTMLSVDPDVAYASAGTNERPLVHWLVMNIQNGSIDRGDEIHSYKGPLPPNLPPHYYYFLLYKQPSILATNVTKYSGGSCTDNTKGRCLFNVTAFTEGNNLSLVGATWLISQNSPFVNYSWIQRGRPVSELCAYTPGYAEPCPGETSGFSIVSFKYQILLYVCGILMTTFYF